MKLVNSHIQAHDTSSSATYPYKIVFNLEFTIEEFNKLKKQDALGLVYNRDLSNFFFRT